MKNYFFLFFIYALSSKGATFKPVEITWSDLYKYDFKSGKVPEDLKKKINQNVKIAGYIVPLGGDLKAMKEALLVPTRGACIHVPAPPPNLVIHVKFGKNRHINEFWGPMVIFGTLKIKSSKTDVATAGWQMESYHIEKYKVK